ncbi:flagellar FliJ family protein [Sinomonas sp.]|jgi:flagellar FliJ protein|uniref:flagellar FliJ family protein n=1 Tax=Sinomonas sp. TaxID=1914986 RepID=UPI003F7EA88B
MSRQFPLAGLLRLRRLEQDQAAAHLGAVNAQLRAVTARKDAALAESERLSSEAADAASLRAIAAARSASSSLLADLEALAALADADAERAQHDLAAARARTLGLEKLEARHAAEAAAAELAAEQNVLDELSGARRGAAR